MSSVEINNTLVLLCSTVYTSCFCIHEYPYEYVYSMNFTADEPHIIRLYVHYNTVIIISIMEG